MHHLAHVIVPLRPKQELRTFSLSLLNFFHHFVVTRYVKFVSEKWCEAGMPGDTDGVPDGVIRRVNLSCA